MSTHAGGTLADQLIFSNWKGRAYVKRHRAPKQPRSPGQVAMRAMMSFLSAEWIKLIPENKADWQPLADQTAISPFNAFLGHNLQRWARFAGPSKIYPVPEYNTSATTTPLVLYGLRHAIRVTYTVTAVEKGWANNIHHVPGTGQPIHYDDLLHAEPCPGPADKDFIIRGLTPGLHWLAKNCFTTRGYRRPELDYGFATVTD